MRVPVTLVPVEMEPSKTVGLLVGVAIAAIEGMVLIAQNLVVYNEATRLPLIGGGVFGLFVGSITSLLTVATLQPRAQVITCVITGIAGFLSVYCFYDIVAAERDFSGRGVVLFGLAFVIATALLYLTTVFSLILAGQHGQSKPRLTPNE